MQSNNMLEVFLRRKFDIQVGGVILHEMEHVSTWEGFEKWRDPEGRFVILMPIGEQTAGSGMGKVVDGERKMLLVQSSPHVMEALNVFLNVSK